MKRSLIAGVLVVGAGTFFVLHRGTKAETESTTPEAAASDTQTMATHSATAPRLGGPPAIAKPAPAEHANIDGLPEPLEAGYLAVEHAAKTCYRGRPVPQPIRPNGPDGTVESIRLSYRQVVKHGVGHVEDLKINDGKLTDQALESCIVKMTSAATWSSPAPDGEIGELEQNIALGDLMRPDYGLPPPSKRSPTPTAPPPPELAGPLGKQAEQPEDDHPGVVVSAPKP